ncbi:hypothetical protein C8R45DRAFT_990075 [Mycena sanguinolenta]|nr:hypothetical protein C8R45DRAFT_990075 [Mycena sanguinolenta]
MVSSASQIEPIGGDHLMTTINWGVVVPDYAKVQGILISVVAAFVLYWAGVSVFPPCVLLWPCKLRVERGRRGWREAPGLRRAKEREAEKSTESPRPLVEGSELEGRKIRPRWRLFPGSSLPLAVVGPEPPFHILAFIFCPLSPLALIHKY